MSSTPLILCIETSTLSCSVALLQGESVIASRQVAEQSHVHAEQLLPLIQTCLQESGLSQVDLRAVAVSKGPGSYTGLRIGVSTAKGICHALSIPLIAIDGLEILAHDAWKRHAETEILTIIPVMDARRNEVYTATYKAENGRIHCIQPTRALVLDQHSTSDELSEVFAGSGSSALVIGDAADKCRQLISSAAPTWEFLQTFPNAMGMAGLALEAYRKERFENVAYFEPSYLKDFQAGAPKDPLGLRNQA